MSITAALTGDIEVHQYFSEWVRDVHTGLMRMTDERILANDEQTLVEYFLSRDNLEPVEIDSTRETTATHTKELHQTGLVNSSPLFGEVRGAAIHIPLVPRATNSKVLKIRASAWPFTLTGNIRAKYDDVTHILTIETN